MTKGRYLHPDIDNMLKAVFDSLKKHVITDDRHISQVEAKKYPRATQHTYVFIVYEFT